MKKTLRSSLIILCLFVLLPGVSFGRHIIGGSMTYKCLGNGDYEFTLKVYRDCFCTRCAEIDPVAFIGVYRCGPTAPCNGQGSALARLNVPLTDRRNIDRPDYPCLEPPAVCTEEGTYIFRLSRYGIRLPTSVDNSYFISYQRCCRNETITNIVNPDSWGATYMVEITPEAQRLCNNSPEFNTFPPTVVCADFNLRYDHSAKDADGDQLVYEFCPPFDGGANNLEPFIYNTCDGAYPNPGCPPPYKFVPFRPPLYSATSPIGGDPPLSINSQTGLITGKPNPIGQYVVGVCVSEYRNGVLLSRIFRDFQFNVAKCDPKLLADIREDIKINDKEYLVNSCGPTAVKFINESTPRSFIRTSDWEFDLKNTKLTSTEWEPSILFPGVGTYNGRLILNKGTECGDTAKIFVNIYPALTADFDYAYDTCVSGPVKFTDKSVSGGKFLTGWKWDFGDKITSILQNPEHLYRNPGKIPVSLTVRDTNKCVEKVSKTINYFPVPNLIVVSPSASQGCVPMKVKFTNLSFPIDSTYKILWKFGDGGSAKAISPTYTYNDPGVFTVSLDITSPIGCKTDTTFKDLIKARPSPKAGFTIDPPEATNLTELINLFDDSQGAIRWNWQLSNGRNFTERSPSFSPPDTGRINVRQIVVNSVNCLDTLDKILDIRPEVRYFLPNAFTPNGDSVNDEFKGVGVMAGAKAFNFTIWNRWGELIYQTDSPNKGWNGRKFNAGAESPPGVYVVLVTYRDPRGNPYELKGFVTLIR